MLAFRFQLTFDDVRHGFIIGIFIDDAIVVVEKRGAHHGGGRFAAA